MRSDRHHQLRPAVDAISGSTPEVVIVEVRRLRHEVTDLGEECAVFLGIDALMIRWRCHPSICARRSSRGQSSSWFWVPSHWITLSAPAQEGVGVETGSGRASLLMKSYSTFATNADCHAHAVGHQFLLTTINPSKTRR